MPALTDRQLAERKQAIGSSDIPIILGLWAKYDKTPQWLLECKWGERVEEPVEAMTWGTRLEPIIRSEVRTRLGVPILRSWKTYRAKTPSWAVCHLDGIIAPHDGNRRVLECKVTRFAGQECPDSYVAQVNWAMMVTGYQWATVAALVGGVELKTWEVERDESLIGNLLAVAEKFYHHLINHLPWED
jgi:predicted phage-related endonuclease